MNCLRSQRVEHGSFWGCLNSFQEQQFVCVEQDAPEEQQDLDPRNPPLFGIIHSAVKL